MFNEAPTLIQLPSILFVVFERTFCRACSIMILAAAKVTGLNTNIRTLAPASSKRASGGVGEIG